MSLCLATPVLALALALPAQPAGQAGIAAQAEPAPHFTLAWTHSVERTEWQEDWRVQAGELVLAQARVRGSGAGMEPPDGAVLRDGWWVYGSALRVTALHLAVSGATGGGWRLCTAADGCRDLERWLSRDGMAPVSITIRPGPCQG